MIIQSHYEKPLPSPLHNSIFLMFMPSEKFELHIHLRVAIKLHNSLALVQHHLHHTYQGISGHELTTAEHRDNRSTHNHWNSREPVKRRRFGLCCRRETQSTVLTKLQCPDIQRPGWIAPLSTR